MSGKLPNRVRQQTAWMPWDWSQDIAGASAIQAVAEGRADEEQQKRALKAIVEGVCQTYELSYSPDSERDSAFAEGKRFVGLQIAKLLRLNLTNLKRTQPNG
jgi:hypothetical protein